MQETIWIEHTVLGAENLWN